MARSILVVSAPTSDLSALQGAESGRGLPDSVPVMPHLYADCVERLLPTYHIRAAALPPRACMHDYIVCARGRAGRPGSLSHMQPYFSLAGLHVQASCASHLGSCGRIVPSEGSVHVAVDTTGPLDGVMSPMWPPVPQQVRCVQRLQQVLPLAVSETPSDIAP